MNNPKSKYLIVVISLAIGALHFLIDPGYNGPLKEFVTGYLIDILLPMNIYLLTQLPLRKHYAIKKSRWIGMAFTFLIGCSVEILQYFGFAVFGNTFDPIDILMYALGILLGLSLDMTLIKRFEDENTSV